MDLYNSKMMEMAEKLLLHVYGGDLKNRISGTDIVHWYGAFLILGRSFSTLMAQHGITPTQLDAIREVAIGERKLKMAKA